MSVRRLRTELKELRSRIERQRRPVFILVEHGETEKQALDRIGINATDPRIDVSVVGIFSEERNI